MTREELLDKLCYYDIRNPYCPFDEEELLERKKDVNNNGPCYCDNCFYGRTPLAEELLKYIQ